MARSGELFENPVTGETARVLVSTQDGDGRLLRVACTAPRGLPRGGLHLHPRSEERYEVQAGTLGLTIDGTDHEVGPGERATVQAGQVHEIWNAGDEELRFVLEITEPGRLELLMETLWGLARDGHLNDRGEPSLLQLAVLAQAYDEEIRFASPPRPVQKVLVAVLAPVGRALGLREAYPRYSLSVAD